MTGTAFTRIRQIIITIRQDIADPLYRNSGFLFFTSISNSVLGLIFWILSAHLYSVADVGIATALISAMLLIGNLAIFGFDIGIIRFLPSVEKKDVMLNTCLTLITLFSLVFSIIFITGITFWMPDLTSAVSSHVIACTFILITLVSALLLFQKNVFIAFRAAQYSFIQYLVISISKILIVTVLVFLGAFGIITAYGISAIIGLALSVLILMPLLLPDFHMKLSIDRTTVNTLYRFSFGHYIAQNLSSLPMTLFPILILSAADAEMSAYFFMAWSIAQFIFTIPWSVGLSLFAEGSHKNQDVTRITRKAQVFSLGILVPIVIIVLLFSPQILLIFGKNYSENASVLLAILALSSLPFLYVEFFLTTERIAGNVMSVLACYGFTTVTTVLLGFALLPLTGIAGIGIAWLAAYSLLSGIIFLYTRFGKKSPVPDPVV